MASGLRLGLWVAYALFVWLFVGPLVFVYAWRFYKSRHVLAVKKRRISTTLSISAFTLVYSCFVSVSVLGIALKVLKLGVWFWRFVFLLYGVCLHGLVWSHVFRIYIIWYNIRYTKAVESGKWKTLLSREVVPKRERGHRPTSLFNMALGSGKLSVETEDYSPWIRHKGTFGEFHFMRRVFAAIGSTMILIAISLQYVRFRRNSRANFQMRALVDSCLLLVPIILMAVLHCKTPEYRDLFRVRDEITRVLVTGSVMVVLYAIVPFMQPLIGAVPTYFLMSGILPLLLPLSTLFTTAWVLEFSGVVEDTHYEFKPLLHSVYNTICNCDCESMHLVKAPKSQTTKKTLSVTAGSIGNNSPISEGKEADFDAPVIEGRFGFGGRSASLFGRSRAPQLKASDVKLSTLLSDTRGFDSMMGHLFEEFSSENLLCLVELVQFHQRYGGERLEKVFRLPASDFPPRNVPKSAVVHRADWSPQKKACVLCEKYILHGAIFPVNLSSGTRNKLIDMYAAQFATCSVALDLMPVADVKSALQSVATEVDVDSECKMEMSPVPTLLKVTQKGAADSSGEKTKMKASIALDLQKVTSDSSGCHSRAPSGLKRMLSGNRSESELEAAKDEIADVFNNACIEVYFLMQDSFMRFRDSEKFKLWFKDYLHNSVATSAGSFQRTNSYKRGRTITAEMLNFGKDFLFPKTPSVEPESEETETDKKQIPDMEL